MFLWYNIINMIILNVPYSEKDEAKSIGAKWSPKIKSWYVDDGFDEAIFEKWIVPEVVDGVELSLSQVMGLVKRTINSNLGESYWIRAEVSGVSHKRHVYFDLVEFDSGKNEVAKCKATLWESSAEEVLTNFKVKTSEGISEGMSILIKANIDFHNQYGISLNIIDIDPSYTVGSRQVKINEIINNLTVNGIINNNKAIPVPGDFSRVAVISPENAAGLGDFKVEAEKLERVGLCKFFYYESVFQGVDAGLSIAKSFAKIDSDFELDGVDAVVLIRGGGSNTDLHFVNDLDVAMSILGCKFPVLCGIGHEKDVNIPDIISSMAFDTPSKVAGFIVDSIYRNAMGAEHHHALIRTISKDIIDKSNMVLDSYINNILVFSGVAVRNSEALLLDKINKVSIRYGKIISDNDKNLLFIYEKIMGGVRGSVVRAEADIKNHIVSVLQNNPISILNKGFAIIKQGGVYVTNVDDISIGEEMDITMKDGNISILTKGVRE